MLIPADIARAAGAAIGLADLVSHARRVSTEFGALEALTDWMYQAVMHFSTLRCLVGILAQSILLRADPPR